jgi:hypothetical protein
MAPLAQATMESLLFKVTIHLRGIPLKIRREQKKFGGKRIRCILQNSVKFEKI